MRRKREIKMPEYTIRFEDGEATKEEQMETILQILGVLADGYMKFLQKGEDLSNEEIELSKKLFSQDKNFDENQP